MISFWFNFCYHQGGHPLKKPLLPCRFLSLALCFALLCGLPLPLLAAPTPEPTDENAWVDPTRAPGASPWSSDIPDYLEPEMLIAQSAILVEMSTGEIVFEKNAHQIMYPASTTKILTTYLGIQFGDLDEDVTVSEQAIWEATQESDSSLLPLSAGEKIKMRDLLYGTMLKSANDGANVIAETVSGSIESFVELMNQTAVLLGCRDTHFNNTHGLPDENHYTTVYDMALIAREAMRSDVFRDIAQSYTHEMPVTNKRPRRTVTSSNVMMQETDSGGNPNNYYYPFSIGIKTGYHSQAGYCFVGAAERNGIEMLSVVFYTSRRGRWVDTKALLEYGFTQYSSTDPISMYNADPREIEIAGFALDDNIGGVPSLGRLKLGIRVAEGYENVKVVGTANDITSMRDNLSSVSHVNWVKEFSAPVTVGDVMGVLTFYPVVGDPVEYELYATRTIYAREDSPPTLEEIIAYTDADPSPLPRFSEEYVVIPLAIIALLWMLLRRRRRKRIRKRKHAEHKLPKPQTRTFR